VSVVAAEHEAEAEPPQAPEETSYQFKSVCSLELDMSLPNWVPAVGIIEKRGSRAFQAMLDKDVGRLIERFRCEFLEWSSAIQKEDNAHLQPTPASSFNSI
jgi:hypothetical protein